MIGSLPDPSPESEPLSLLPPPPHAASEAVIAAAIKHAAIRFILFFILCPPLKIYLFDSLVGEYSYNYSEIVFPSFKKIYTYFAS